MNAFEQWKQWMRQYAPTFARHLGLMREAGPAPKRFPRYQLLLVLCVLAYAVIYWVRHGTLTPPSQLPPSVPVTLKGEWVGMLFDATPVRLVFEDSTNGSAYFQYPEGTIWSSVGISPGYRPPRQGDEVFQLLFMARGGEVFEWRGTIGDSRLDGRFISGFTHNPRWPSMVFTRVVAGTGP